MSRYKYRRTTIAAVLPARIVPQDGIAVSVYTIQYIYIYIYRNITSWCNADIESEIKRFEHPQGPSLGLRRAYARNVRLRFPYRQYINF